MKHTVPLKAALLSLCLLGGAADAALVLAVDTSTQEYYFEGSATGTPQSMFGSSSITWDNEQGLSGSQYAAFLENNMLLVLGVLDQNSIAFIHAPGNVNGALDFSGEFGSVTVVANSAARGSYATWDPAIIAEFESKAALGETVASPTDSNFNIQFSTVPEPTSSLLGLLGFCSVILRRRR